MSTDSKQMKGTDSFLMVFSKLDQRCERAFVHIRTERRDAEGDEARARFVG